MSSLQSSHTKKGKSRKGASSGGPCGGGGRVQTYLHAVTAAHAARLENTKNRHPLKDVARKTGAGVQFDSNPSPVPGMKIIIIHGSPSQIEAAVRSISQITGAKGTISEEAQKFWIRWVEDCFPDLDSRAYFLPPVNPNRISMSKRPFAGKYTLILQTAPGKASQSAPGQSAPGQTSQSAPGQSGQSVPGQSGQSVPGQSGQAAPGQSGQSVPGQSGQAAPGQSSQLAPGQSSQSAPGQSSQSAPGQSGQAAPGQSSQSAPGQSSQLAPGQSSQSAPGQSSQSAPGQTGQSAPGQTGQTAPGQSASGQSSQSAPGQPAPGQSHQSAPGQSSQSASSQSAPGQSSQSAPGQSSQSVPGQAAQPQKSASTVTQASIPEPLKVFDSDIRDDAAMQRVLFFLHRISEENKEVLFGISQLQFEHYLGESCYAAAAAHLPLASSLPPSRPRNWKRGDFDVLLIHRHYGLIVCEVKSFGSITKELNMSQEDRDNNIRKKVSLAASQLNKAEAMLSHLVSDIAPGLRITKTIAVPNLTAHRVQQAISGDQQLTQDLCRCLGTTDPDSITGLCLCYDHLDPKTPLDSSEDLLRELGNWWQRCVAGAGPDGHMTSDVYKTLVARFCGPATTVTVPCTSPPRLCIKTLGQAVFLTGQCYTAEITLFPEQFQLLISAPARLYVAGPPGTGKTVVLLLMATEWLRCGDDVYIVSTGFRSLSTSSMLCHLLKQTVNAQHTCKIHLLEYDFYYGKDVEKAVDDLSQKAKGGKLYVIADEVRHDCKAESYFPTFGEKLLTLVPNLHLWAASYFHEFAPKGWQVELLTRPLRSPPTIVREVRKDTAFVLNTHLRGYTERGVPDHTDGQPVKRLIHDKDEGHSGYYPADCVTCGQDIASFLRSLRVGDPGNAMTSSTPAASTNSGTTTPGLQWRDVLVLAWGDVGEKSNMVTALSQAGIKVQVMKDEDTEDVATARSDVVWVANGRRVLGLERKVVVCLDSGNFGYYAQLDLMSRCTSQLVIVSRAPEETATVFIAYSKLALEELALEQDKIK